MSKVITADELSEIVKSLLQGGRGEDDTAVDEYLKFVTEVAEAVCEYCGGEVRQATMEDIDDHQSVAMVAVRRSHKDHDDDLSVWADYDPDGEL